MSKKDEALKLALEALERHAELGLLAGSTITAIREALADNALDRMAENARELGLDYEPAQQQEPVGYTSQSWLAQSTGGQFSKRKGICGDVALYTSPQPSKPLTDEQRKAIVVCFTSGKVSVSEVQRKLAISYNEAQKLCQSIVDLGLAEGLQLAPSLDRHGIKGDA